MCVCWVDDWYEVCGIVVEFNFYYWLREGNGDFIGLIDFYKEGCRIVIGVEYFNGVFFVIEDICRDIRC